MYDNTRAREAATKIAAMKDRPPVLIDDYLAIGDALKQIKDVIPYNTKLRGQKIKEEYPEFGALNPSQRSNCLRLWEFLIGDDAPAFLEVLGVSNIRDYYTSNPTVIMRDYRNKKREQSTSLTMRSIT